MKVQNGVPEIAVDGKAVRARIFYGAPGRSSMLIDQNPRNITIDFIAQADSQNAGDFQFRFGEQSGQIWIANLSVSDLDGHSASILHEDFGDLTVFNRRWHHWPPESGGAVELQPGAGPEGGAALHVAIQSADAKNWPDFHLYRAADSAIVKGRHYRISFWAHADQPRRISVALYRPGSPYVLLGPDVFSDQIALAAATGVNFVSFSINLSWPPPGKPDDWTDCDTKCEQVLRANPNAILIPRIGCNAPQWWLDAHPDEVMAWDDGPANHPFTNAIPSSALYRHDCAEHLAALIEHAEQKFGSHIGGYHPTGQNTGEWFYINTWNHGLNGYANGDRRDWRAWLAAKYPKPEMLRTAWNDPAADVQTATVPAPAERRRTPNGVLLDARTQQRLLDFIEFQQQSMADCVASLASAARQASGGRKLILFFYGYLFEFANAPNGPASSGHYALSRLLKNPNIDILCSPISYRDRGLGQSAPSMSAAESVELAGKIWLDEDDTYTFLAQGTPPGFTDRVDTLAESNQELLRNTGQCAIRNFATWWMDLGATGWFDDPGLWKQMSALNALDAPLLQTPRPYRPQIAAVIDEAGMMNFSAEGDRAAGPLISGARAALGRTGAPFGQYLFDDVAGGLVQPKMVVMLDAWSVDAVRARRLLDSTRGAMHVWCYAPGAQTGTPKMLTGFDLRSAGDTDAWAGPTALGKSLGLTGGIGLQQRVRPLFYAADATTTETLATYSNGQSAIALRDTPDGPSLFVGTPALSSELLRIAAGRAGVHLYTSKDCVVYVNGPFAVLHGTHDGPIDLDTGRNEPIINLLTHQTIGQGPKLQLSMEKGKTLILQMGKD